MLNSRDSLLTLYDLEADKQENYPVETTHPGEVELLLNHLAAWEQELIPPLWPGVMEYEEEFDGVKMRFAF